MLSANNHYGYVLATEVQKEDGPFNCPECRTQVILKQGSRKIPHFAHLVDGNCPYRGEAESREHSLAKLEINDALKLYPEVSKLQLERILNGVRADVSFCLNKRYYIAIEVQISPLPIDDLIRRTMAYTRQNIYVLWAPVLPLEILQERYAPKDWERKIHALYQGTIYYWVHSLDLVPVHFEEYMVAPNWFSDEKPSKRFVYPRMSPQVSILQLSPLRQPQRYPYPAAKLWCLPPDLAI